MIPYPCKCAWIVLWQESSSERLAIWTRHLLLFTPLLFHTFCKLHSPITPYTPFILCKLFPNLGIQTYFFLLWLLFNSFCCQVYSGVPFFGIPSYDTNSAYLFSQALPIFARFFCSTQSESFILLSHHTVLPSFSAISFRILASKPTESFANYIAGFLSPAFPRIFWTQHTSPPTRCTFSFCSPWPT